MFWLWQWQQPSALPKETDMKAHQAPFVLGLDQLVRQRRRGGEPDAETLLASGQGAGRCAFCRENRSQLDRVRGELSELQRQWDESAYERHQADTVIRALDRALDNSDLRIRDRDRLTNDLDQLRDFRDSHN